jgi:hypothetical protein
MSVTALTCRVEGEETDHIFKNFQFIQKWDYKIIHIVMVLKHVREIHYTLRVVNSENSPFI